MNYFATHAGKGVLFIAGAALVLAVPIALPWITASRCSSWASTISASHSGDRS